METREIDLNRIFVERANLEILNFKFSEKAASALNTMFNSLVSNDIEVRAMGLALIETHFKGLPHKFFVGLGFMHYNYTVYSQYRIVKDNACQFITLRLYDMLRTELIWLDFINLRKCIAKKEAILKKLEKINKKFSNDR